MGRRSRENNKPESTVVCNNVASLSCNHFSMDVWVLVHQDSASLIPYIINKERKCYSPSLRACFTAHLSIYLASCPTIQNKRFCLSDKAKAENIMVISCMVTSNNGSYYCVVKKEQTKPQQLAC